MRLLHLSLALACACGVVDEAETDVPQSGDKADRVSGTGLRFNGDFGEELSGALRAGDSLRVSYDLDRLPGCRGTSGGRPQWNITGFMSIDGAAAQTFEVSRVQGDERVPVDAVLTVPAGRDLAFWFQVNNRWGCSEFDSDFGNNYHFVVGATDPAPRAHLTFDAEGKLFSEGSLRSGGKVVVSYDLDRLPACRGTSGGLPQWTITGFAQVDGGTARSFEVSRVAGDDREPIDAELELPRGASLSLWFQVTNRWGCSEYDGNGGSNYVFQLN